MAITYYDTGTISLTNGSAVVTGTGTGWQTALIAGGVVYPEAGGNPLPIASVDSNTQITATIKWTGATGTYSYALARQDDVNQVMRNAQTLSEVVEEIRNGTIFKYDVSGNLADRNMYGAQPKGFAYLVTEGDSADLYVKVSSTLNDWAGPFSYGAGPVGPAPSLGIGTVITRDTGEPADAAISGSNGVYALNLALPRGGKGFAGWAIELSLVDIGAKQVFRVADFIGGEGQKPDGIGLYVGLGGLVESIDDAIDVRGLRGPQGVRGVTWRGAWSAVFEYLVGDIVIDDDSGGAPATWISADTNTNKRPRDNPASWQYFPGSVPRVQDYGLVTDATDETRDYGILADG